MRARPAGSKLRAIKPLDGDARFNSATIASPAARSTSMKRSGAG